MTVTIDAARQHKLARCVDLLPAHGKPFGERDDLSRDDADVTAHRIGRGSDRAAANDQVKFRFH